MKDPSADQDSQDATGQRGMLVTQGSPGFQDLSATKVNQDCKVQRETRTSFPSNRTLKEQQDHKDETEKMG